MNAFTFTKRAKIITAVVIAATIATGGGYIAHQKNVEAQAIKAAKVEKLKAEDNKERKDVQIIKDKLATTDRVGLAKLQEEAKTVKDPARKTQLSKAIKETTARLDKADKVAAEKKAADAKKAEEAKKAAEAQKSAETQKAAEAQAAEAQAAAEAAAAEQAAQEQAAQQAQAAAKPAAKAETSTSAQASAPAQQSSPAPEAATVAPATQSAPSYSIAGYSSVAIANSQAFIDNSRYSWISLSDVPTAGGVALLGHADAAGTWVAGANVGDIVTVSGVSYQIYNKYTVGWNSPGEWDAIQSCGSGEVSIITCTDASGQSDWVLRAKRI